MDAVLLVQLAPSLDQFFAVSAVLLVGFMLLRGLDVAVLLYFILGAVGVHGLSSLAVGVFLVVLEVGSLHNEGVLPVTLRT